MASDTYGAILLTTANDVGAMLQKKMATPSKTYAPAVWAETINLLGKLPEATVSGSIATLDDGADDVPTKSLVVTIPPTLSGVSEVAVKQSGINHIQDANIVQGSFNSNGANVDTVTTRIRTDNYIPLAAGTYKIENKEGYQYVVYVYSSESWQSYISAESLVSWQTYGSTFTLTNDRYVRIGWRKSNNENILPSEIHDYILYDTTSFTQYTAQLGRTIHGGQVDIVNGVGTDENGDDFTFDGQEIPTRLGYNAFWSDSGDTEVTYRRDIDLALQSLSGSRGLMMARPPAAAETEETEPEDEITETIEETPEDMEK